MADLEGDYNEPVRNLKRRGYDYSSRMSLSSTGTGYPFSSTVFRRLEQEKKYYIFGGPNRSQNLGKNMVSIVLGFLFGLGQFKA